MHTTVFLYFHVSLPKTQSSYNHSFLSFCFNDYVSKLILCNCDLDSYLGCVFNFSIAFQSIDAPIMMSIVDVNSNPFCYIFMQCIYHPLYHFSVSSTNMADQKISAVFLPHHLKVAVSPFWKYFFSPELSIWILRAPCYSPAPSLNNP